MGIRIAAFVEILPLPLRAWAAKRTKVGGRGARSHAPPRWAPLPPTLIRFAAKALKGRGSILLRILLILTPMGMCTTWRT